MKKRKDKKNCIFSIPKHKKIRRVFNGSLNASRIFEPWYSYCPNTALEDWSGQRRNWGLSLKHPSGGSWTKCQIFISIKKITVASFFYIEYFPSSLYTVVENLRPAGYQTDKLFQLYQQQFHLNRWSQTLRNKCVDIAGHWVSTGRIKCNTVQGGSLR